MSEYYKTRPLAAARPQAPPRRPESNTKKNNASDSDSSEDDATKFDRHRKQLIAQDLEEGWASELERYLDDMPADVKKYTDIVAWWSVSTFTCSVANANSPTCPGTSEAVPYPRSHCARCPPGTCIIRSVRAVVFWKQAYSNGSTVTTWCRNV